MASTNKTTNYDLSQFIETDKPGWLTDYNSDMRKLDTALKGVSDVASGASGGISSLTDRMTAAEGAITTTENDIEALEARADTLEAQAQSSAGAIAGIQTEQTVQNAGIEAATELGYNLARPYDSASTYAVGAYVLFQNTLYKCITAVSTGEAFDPSKWLAIKVTDEIKESDISYRYYVHPAVVESGTPTASGITISNMNFLPMIRTYCGLVFVHFNIAFTISVNTVDRTYINIPLTWKKLFNPAGITTSYPILATSERFSPIAPTSMQPYEPVVASLSENGLEIPIFPQTKLSGYVFYSHLNFILPLNNPE